MDFNRGMLSRHAEMRRMPDAGNIHDQFDNHTRGDYVFHPVERNMVGDRKTRMKDFHSRINEIATFYPEADRIAKNPTANADSYKFDTFFEDKASHYSKQKEVANTEG